MKAQKIKIQSDWTQWETVYELQNDYERFPIPICFDPYDELKALHRRDNKIKAIVERYFRLYKKCNHAKFTLMGGEKYCQHCDKFLKP